MEETMKPPGSSWKDVPIGMWAFVAVAVIALVVAFTNGATDSDDSGSSGGAKVACQDFVKDQLKSPGTADFSEEVATSGAGAMWVVTGVVDSQNSFGGVVRNGYNCKMQYESGDSWRLVNLETDGD